MFGEPVALENGVLEYIGAQNYDFRSDTKRAGELRRLIVWGGDVANCAEDNLSCLVDNASDNLEELTYCPDRTKGGVLIRPKYYKSDRGGKAVFPLLTDMTIRLSPVLLPPENGWLTPSLRRLRLLCVIRPTRRSRDGPLQVMPPSRRDLREWLGVRRCCGGGVLPERMLQACPELESITIALCCTSDATKKQTDWVTVLPPRLVPWEVHRLLLLPILKGAGSASDTTAQPCESLLGRLSLPLVNKVLTFLWSRRWQHRFTEIPSEVIEELQLPPEFQSYTPASLMEAEEQAA